jgi:hypothetical protein
MPFALGRSSNISKNQDIIGDSSSSPQASPSNIIDNTGAGESQFKQQQSRLLEKSPDQDNLRIGGK